MHISGRNVIKECSIFLSKYRRNNLIPYVLCIHKNSTHILNVSGFNYVPNKEI